jgi:hypothetical protein
MEIWSAGRMMLTGKDQSIAQPTAPCGWLSTVLEAGRLRVHFPMVSLEFFINPLLLLFKALLHGQRDCFFSGHLNV